MDTESKNKGGYVIKTCGIIVKTILILTILMAVFFLIRALVFHKTDVFGYRIYIIMSGSMQPEINLNDAVVTKEASQYQEGDIIAFKTEDSVTIHRIVNIQTNENKKLYQTKGDNNNIEDPHLVGQTQVKGKVVKKIPGVGNIVLFLKRNIVFILLGLTIIVIIAIGIVLIRRLI